VDCITATNDGLPDRARIHYLRAAFLEPLKFVPELWSLAHACSRGLRSPDSDRQFIQPSETITVVSGRRFDHFVSWVRKQTWEQGELEDTDFLKDSEEKGVSLDVKNSDTTVIELKLI
jgi:hypothetical protein